MTWTQLPFWKTFQANPRCPASYPQKAAGRSGSTHPKCCAGCPYPEKLCATPLDCGERCYLPSGHDGPCLCIGDENGEPGTCPA